MEPNRYRDALIRYKRMPFLLLSPCWEDLGSEFVKRLFPKMLDGFLRSTCRNASMINLHWLLVVNTFFLLHHGCGAHLNYLKSQWWWDIDLSHSGQSKKDHQFANYRQVSNIRRTKSQHLKDSRTVLRLSLPNPLKPDVKSRMKMYLEQRRQT